MNKIDTDTESAVFDLNISDSDLISQIRKPYEESKSYWDDTFGLANVRLNNMNLYLPKHYEGVDLYDYQEENKYIDPRVFVSTNTIVGVVNARIPQPGVSPAQDDPISVKLAEDLGRGMYGYVQKYHVDDVFRVGTMNLLLKRQYIIKLRWDDTIGKHGDIVTEIVMPEKITVDKNARWGQTPKFVVEEINNVTFAELLAQFPDSEQEIYELAGCTRTDKKGNLVAYKSQLAKETTIYEAWIQYVEDGKRKSGTAWFSKNFNVVLGKMRNPNWNYETEDGYDGNILDYPIPPYVFGSYLNDGSSFIDITSMVEQVASLQRILDRRGFQIMENADQGSGGKVYNTEMITKEEIAQLSGDPTESVGVKGDVRAAVTRVAPPPLANYVLEDKFDARAQIDDVFGTHDISRGKDSGNKTLGQDQLQINQDYTRLDEISRAHMRTAVDYYRMLAQFMKVYYTEEHWIKIKGEDGQFDFYMLKSDLIEDGIDIFIEEGSNLPLSKAQQQQTVANLMQAGMIDPLTIYEVANGAPMPSPKKMLQRYMAWQTDPMKYAGLTMPDDDDNDALMDIQVLNRGEMPELREEITADYIAFFNKYMIRPAYQKAIKKKPEVESLYFIHLQRAQELAQKYLMLAETQMPTQDQMDVAAAQEAQRAQQSPESQALQQQQSGQQGQSAQQQALQQTRPAQA